MRIAIEYLKDFGLYDTLPDAFKSMQAGDYFVFRYVVDEPNSKLIISSNYSVKQVNVSLFRGLRAEAAKVGKPSLMIGYFPKGNIETRDGLFYLFLRTFNDEGSVNAFYSHCIEIDRKDDVSIAIHASNNIYGPSDFKRIISYFAPSRVQDICACYDFCDAAIQRVAKRSIYGGMITRVVNMVPFVGGVMSEMGGKLRYMVIGEKAVLSEQEKERLDTAKALLRSGQSAHDVYAKTGWFFLENDGKWRMNIGDTEAVIKNTSFVQHEGYNVFIPADSELAPSDILRLISNTSLIYPSAYSGRLPDVLEHSELYAKYPQLMRVPILYYVQPNTQPPSVGHAYYFSPNQRGGFIVIKGSYEWGQDISIMLHEIQHAIQGIEGFATGGNDFLAEFVTSVGGKTIRQIFASINKLTNLFVKLSDEAFFLQLRGALQSAGTKGGARDGYRGAMLQYMGDYDTFFININTFVFYLVIYIVETSNPYDDSVFLKVAELTGDFVYQLYDTVSESYQESKSVAERLAASGFYQDDISTILFQAYQNLYGEQESRSVQESRMVPLQLKNYLYLTKWEQKPTQEILVIDGEETVIDSANLMGACEEKNGKYVLHFKRGANAVPFVHELGHIVYDVMTAAGYTDAIKECFDKQFYHADMDEFFVSRFVGYMAQQVNAGSLYDDVMLDPSVVNDAEMNKILDEFFIGTAQEDLYLSYMAFLNICLEK